MQNAKIRLRSGGLWFQASLVKCLQDPIAREKSWVKWHMLIVPAMVGSLK
jgi:hypothetical protein